MRFKRISRCDGMTLLEVLIAMVIMGISLLLLMNMAMVALDGNDWSNNTTLVTQLMQHKLEQLRAMPNPANGKDTANGIEINWTVSPVGSHLRQIDITANWRDMTADYKTQTLTAFIKSDSV